MLAVMYAILRSVSDLVLLCFFVCPRNGAQELNQNQLLTVELPEEFKSVLRGLEFRENSENELLYNSHTTENGNPVEGGDAELLKSTVEDVQEQFERLSRSAEYQYGERMTPVTLQADLSTAFHRMVQRHGGLISEQGLALKSKFQTLLSLVTMARSSGTLFDKQSFLTELLFLFCTPTTVQKPQKAPSAINGPLVIARVETGKCIKSHSHHKIECFGPKLDVQHVKGNLNLVYISPTVLTTPQCGQNVIFGEITEAVLWQPREAMVFNSLEDFAVEILRSTG
uniref:Uncharacterized protein n=1 Tax=Tetraselmis sp. GSL018 TaxID=582737 RepID=A0A061SMK1_9CHLO|mmetsp:Transcript_16074/g.38125  ORF Transcript_16074/g.38125 Transcript_16074/m.38125 type:complete len:283 (+) Transcript_16074:696-1544(+)